MNGDLGLDSDFEMETWKLEVDGLEDRDTPLQLGLDTIKKLPRTQLITELKCIEGWSVVVHWGGA